MLPGANVQIARAPVGLPTPTSSPWTEALWIETDEREPSLLAELGIPLRCFHRERGYFFSCFLPERGWYWANGSRDLRPERWAAPVRRSGRRPLAY